MPGEPGTLDVVTESEVRDAATVVVLRDAPSGTGHATRTRLEVLMVRRRADSSFGGGAYVFPGGAVDRTDRDPDITNLSASLDDREASRVLGVDSGGLGYFVAAARECFEEAGLLFAGDGSGPVSFLDAPTRERFGRHRSSLNAGATTLAAICGAEHLLLEVERFRYFSHWITPEGGPRRYDTRFFAALAPEGQIALHDDAEVVASEWIGPSVALERHRAGDIHLLFPTVRHLETLSSFSSARQFWDAADSEVQTIQPRITRGGRGRAVPAPRRARLRRGDGSAAGDGLPGPADRGRP